MVSLTLLTISREVRDEIFAYLLRAGSLAILSTCKQVHDELEDRLFQEAVFRVKIGEDFNYAFPANLDSIQNYSFALSFSSTSHHLRFRPLGIFISGFMQDITTCKGNCTIRFVQERYDADLDMFLTAVNELHPWLDETQLVDSLTMFRNVVFELLPTPWPELTDTYEGYGLDIAEAPYRWEDFFEDLVHKLGPGQQGWVILRTAAAPPDRRANTQI